MSSRVGRFVRIRQNTFGSDRILTNKTSLQIKNKKPRLINKQEQYLKLYFTTLCIDFAFFFIYQIFSRFLTAEKLTMFGGNVVVRWRDQ